MSATAIAHRIAMNRVYSVARPPSPRRGSSESVLSGLRREATDSLYEEIQKLVAARSEGVVAGILEQQQLASGLHASSQSFILNNMVQYTNAHLDASFAALSDVTRRGVLERLGRAEASITELAEKFNMTLTGMKKHVGVLEQAGLVITAKVGRVRTCRVGPDRLEEATAWLEKYRQLWAARFDALDKVIEELKQKEKADGLRKME
jgi:DNA-binding transcriptional ArsR family regulator